MIELTRGNVRFTNHCPPDRPESLVSMTRVSDGHRIGQQSWFERQLTDEELAEFADEWLRGNFSLQNEPPPTLCYACGAVLQSDHDTGYQFDNALWVGLHGGYGMFVDACDFPINTEDAWLRSVDEDGGIVLDEEGHPVRDHAWKPVYREERKLPGRPDIEAVICHECAHAACEALPWLARLISPATSHAHHYAAHEQLLAEGHVGWDLKEPTP